jgi:glycerol-3-phosphate acyltransferase PlsX
MREKKDASILVAAELVRKGEADAVVTAGHTGAGMAAGILKLGRLAGVDRPGLAVQMVTDTGPLVLIDIGANPDSTADNLAQYARMGAIFAEKVLDVADPRVALLSIGEEKGKGDARIQRANRAAGRLDAAVRGQRRGSRPSPSHTADVVVTDAVAGNVVIKFFEGLSRSSSTCGAGVPRVLARPLAYLLMRPSIGGSARSSTTRPTAVAAARRQGHVIITHGSAKRRMIGFACDVAARRPRLGSRTSSPSAAADRQRLAELAAATRSTTARRGDDGRGGGS